MFVILDNNIYKSILDAGVYLILYIVIPISQVIAYVINGDKGSILCILLLLLSILYDCYARADNSGKNKKNKDYHDWLFVFLYDMCNYVCICI